MHKIKMTNTMKILAVFITAILAVGFVAPLVLAQEGDGLEVSEVSADTEAELEVELPEAGVSPDSVFHGLDRAIERISLALTLDKVKKAEKALAHAEERLAEVKAMIEAKKLEAAEKAQRQHGELVEEAGDIADEIESNGDEESTGKALNDTLGLKLKMMSHSEKVAFIKNRILERQAGKLTEEQLAHLRAVFEKIEAKATEVEIRIEQKKDSIKIRYKVAAELSDEELEEFEAEIEERIKEKNEETRIKVRDKLKAKLSSDSSDSDEESEEDDLDEESEEDDSGSLGEDNTSN